MQRWEVIFLKKSLRKISLHKFSLIAFVILILLQAVLYTGIILLSSVPAQLNKINFQIMENTVTSKGYSLEKNISSFVNYRKYLPLTDPNWMKESIPYEGKHLLSMYHP